VRFAVAVVSWLATTVALAVAVPAAWTQLHIVDADGYAAMAEKAAGDSALQSAMASELTTRAMGLAAARGGGRYALDSGLDSGEVLDAARAFTAGPAFPPLFAGANRAAHGWLFTAEQGGDPWAVDVAPMLEDSAIAPLLSRHNVTVPATLKVPVAESLPHSWRPGQLSRLATWGPWVSIGAAVLSGCCALLTLAAARDRGKAFSSLGVSALLVGALGWAGVEVARGRIDDGLNRTTGDVRDIAEVMVRHAEAGLHQWLDGTLVAGAALVGLGVLVAIAGGLRKTPSRT
jgi:hypothetical protein